MVTRMNTCHKIYRHGLIVVALDAKEKNQAGAVELWQAYRPETAGPRFRAGR